MKFTGDGKNGILPFALGQASIQLSLYSALAPSNACRYVDSSVLPLYPFGHGLSYTGFSYRDLSINKELVSSDGSVTVSCTVRNIGDRDGEEVVQLYVSDLLAAGL